MRIRVIDSHTGGEPTRLVVRGGPQLGGGPLAERLVRFREKHDRFRSAVVNEPRGSDPMVGALLCPPHSAEASLAVIFFNNVGYLGMCGHGAMGLMASLGWMGAIECGRQVIETPVGMVSAELHANGEVSVDNVSSYRYRRGVTVIADGFGAVTGDIAWGGNWFFLVESPIDLDVSRIEQLTDFTWALRTALNRRGITGENGAEIDHVELFRTTGPLSGKNFVLCPGRQYDRSPCGTGTSAKVACLHADGLLKPGEVWRQESIIGSVFEATVQPLADRVIPTIRGSAFVNADSRLVLDERDPFCWGIRALESGQ